MLNRGNLFLVAFLLNSLLGVDFAICASTATDQRIAEQEDEHSQLLDQKSDEVLDDADNQKDETSSNASKNNKSKQAKRTAAKSKSTFGTAAAVTTAVVSGAILLAFAKQYYQKKDGSVAEKAGSAAQKVAAKSKLRIILRSTDYRDGDCYIRFYDSYCTNEDMLVSKIALSLVNKNLNLKVYTHTNELESFRGFLDIDNTKVVEGFNFRFYETKQFFNPEFDRIFENFNLSKISPSSGCIYLIVNCPKTRHNCRLDLLKNALKAKPDNLDIEIFNIQNGTATGSYICSQYKHPGQAGTEWPCVNVELAQADLFELLAQ